MATRNAITTIVHTFRRLVVTRQLKNHQRLHLGCGSRTLNGWANIDRYAAADVIAWDISNGLPAKDNSIEFIYSEHFIEHLTRAETLGLLKECRRVLKPGGVFRVSTPDLNRLVDDYLANNLEVWKDVDWYPTTPCQLLNEGMRSWGHQFVYDRSELESILREAGFSSIERLAHGVSEFTSLQALESRPDHGDLILEAYID